MKAYLTAVIRTNYNWCAAAAVAAAAAAAAAAVAAVEGTWQKLYNLK